MYLQDIHSRGLNVNGNVGEGMLLCICDCEASFLCACNLKETREGCPGWLLETEVNGVSKSANERGPSFIHVACRACTRDFCSALAALVGPVQNIFSSPYTISMPLSPSPSKLGRQPCWVACLLVCVCASNSPTANLRKPALEVKRIPVFFIPDRLNFLCPFAVYYLRYAVRSFFTISRRWQKSEIKSTV